MIATSRSPRALRNALVDRFAWVGDRTDDTGVADLTGWWRDPAVLAEFGPALANLYPGTDPPSSSAPNPAAFSWAR